MNLIRFFEHKKHRVKLSEKYIIFPA